jgi:uncharacterized protein with FMN-binding domain
MKLLILLLLTLSVSFLEACKPTQLGSEPSIVNLQDGIYIGNAEGINKATVEVQITNNQIVKVKLIKLDATPFGQKAKDSIPERIVLTQKTHVDAVSGATEASNTIMNATIDAINKAKTK